MFNKALNVDLTLKQRMDRLTKNNNYLVMSVSRMQIAQNLRKMKLYHSFTNLGWSHHNLNNKIIALDEFGASATPIIIQTKDLEMNFKAVAPKLDKLPSPDLSNKAEELDKDHMNTIKAPSFILIPPF